MLECATRSTPGTTPTPRLMQLVNIMSSGVTSDANNIYKEYMDNLCTLDTNSSICLIKLMLGLFKNITLNK